MTEKQLGGAGLRGQIAGNTALCTVGQEGSGLTYCGYPIEVLAEKATFEEVAWLLLRGSLPNRTQLEAYRDKLQSMRSLPDPVCKALEQIPSTAHPMDVLRSGCSVLGNLETEKEHAEGLEAADRLLACMPSIVLYWHRFVAEGVRIETRTDENSQAGHFLRLLHDTSPSAEHQQCLDCSLILYAEHEYNASTFAARICASTLSDIHSCVVGAIGTLRGPLHGGANEAAMELMQQFKTPDEARTALAAMLERKEKVMGFGHAIYRKSDPRNAIIHQWAKKLAVRVEDKVLLPVAEAIDQMMWDEKKLFPNADFYHAPAYHFMGIPIPLFTPIFVCSRVAGWTAHVMEQRINNRIIRPSAEYVGPELQQWTALDDRT